MGFDHFLSQRKAIIVQTQSKIQIILQQVTKLAGVEASIKGIDLLAANVEAITNFDLWPKVIVFLQQVPDDVLNYEIDAMYVYGVALLNTGQPAHALTFLQRAKLLYQSRKDLDREITCLIELIRIYQQIENFHAAIFHLEEARDILPSLKDKHLRARLLLRTAELYPDMGKLREGLDYAKQALTIFQREGDIYSQFKAQTLMVVIMRQIGLQQEADMQLELAKRLFLTGELNPKYFSKLLNAEIHMFWDKGDLTTALKYTKDLRTFADTNHIAKARIYARILLGNIERAREEYETATIWYRETEQVALSLGMQLYLPWVRVQMGWLKVLQNELIDARRLFYQALETTDHGQIMSFNVSLAILNLLTNRLDNTHETLFISQKFYQDSGDDLSVHVIEWYLAYLYLLKNEPDMAAARIKCALKWFDDQNRDYFPHWWHPGIVGEVGAFALANHICPDLVERIFIKHLGNAGIVALKALLPLEDVQTQARVKDIITILQKDFSDQLQWITDPDIKRILELGLESDFLCADHFEQLKRKLSTSTQRKNGNPVLLAVYMLYLQGFGRVEIAEQVRHSESLVKNYITEIYRTFHLPQKQGQSRRKRKALLTQASKDFGFIYPERVG